MSYPLDKQLYPLEDIWSSVLLSQIPLPDIVMILLKSSNDRRHLDSKPSNQIVNT